jgi:hypothetical protein
LRFADQIQIWIFSTGTLLWKSTFGKSMHAQMILALGGPITSFDPQQRESLVELQIAIQGLSVPVRTLFRGLLHENPLERISLAETRESDWVLGKNPGH